MNRELKQSAEKYSAKRKRRSAWKKVVAALGCVVVFCTTYALILPALTLEKETVCGLEEHTHTESCFRQLTERADSVLTCRLPETQGHTHAAACFNVQPVCGQEETEGHAHTAACFDASPVCGSEETEGHAHGEDCCETVVTVLDTQTVTCTLSEDENHTHTALCYGTWEQVCTLSEHAHADACYAGEPQQDEAVVAVMALIDAMPTADEIEERLAAAQTQEAYSDYGNAVAQQGRQAYDAYLALSEAQQAQVTNLDRLMESSWLWSRDTLDVKRGIEVWQVNAYQADSSHTTLLRGGSAADYGISFDFEWWSAIVVEQSASGTLYVSQVVTGQSDKRAYGPTTENGFVLLVWSTTIPFDQLDVSVGDAVCVSFDHSVSGSYNGTAYGTVTFADGAFKPHKDNTAQLDVVPGADTNGLIEVNLYDYGTNSNDLYNANKKYPGFQQDKGSIGVTDLDDPDMSFNFGNNITADLAAGREGLTVKDGESINATVDRYDGTEYGYANIPVSGAMLPTLQNGYPALADGTSLDYLFTNGAYATKKNNGSVNGLFQYDAQTGAYHFNSRENHAQFNAQSDTFTLYRQIISSNFMMYPFGNFLPFNDITHKSAQASTIDRAYLMEIANSAQYKSDGGYNRTDDDEYGVLAQQLKKFIALMDAEYGTDWDAYDAVNRYFAAAGLNASFTDTAPQLRPGQALMDAIYSIDYDEETDFYFGMEMKMTFLQPKGGMTGTDQDKNGVPDHPMVFYFTGDDDVWVYIDDVLFLDLSGIHRHVGGRIDFVNGVVSYYVLDPATGDVAGEPYRTETFAQILGSTEGLNGAGAFADYSTHSFHFYYMERGAGSGVCRMNFNFPLLRQNAISVSKEVSADTALLGDPDYRFQILRADADGSRTEELFIPAATPYVLYGEDGTPVQAEGLQTDENGVFTLKAGQRAEFTGISEDAGQYYVRELLSGTVLAQYGNVTVSGESTTTVGDVTVGSDSFTGRDSPVKDMSSGAADFRFINEVDEDRLGSLSVTKQLTELNGTGEGKTFAIAMTLDGTPLQAGTVYTVGDETRTVSESGVLTLAAGETAVIDGILAGTAYAVQETAASAEGYVVTYTVDGRAVTGQSAGGVMGVSAAVELTVHNAQKGIKVPIALEKTLLNNGLGNAERQFTFLLTQVVSDTDHTAVGESLPFVLTVPPRTETVTEPEAFVLTFAQTDMVEETATYYYLLQEEEVLNDPAVQYDVRVYLITVTVSRGADGELSAAMTFTSGGTEYPGAAFRNVLDYYEMPETGGSGTHLYTLAGLLLLCSAAYLLYKQRKCAREGA